METSWAVAIPVDNDTEWMVEVNWLGFDASEITWELVTIIYQDVSAYLVSLLRKLKLTKPIRSALQETYCLKVQLTCCVVGYSFLSGSRRLRSSTFSPQVLFSARLFQLRSA